MDEESYADEMAAFRYDEFTQPNGHFMWAVVVAENAKCKNGKEKQVLHFAKVIDSRKATWSDQLQDKVLASYEDVWRMDLAKRCKGEGQNQIVVSKLPFKDDKEALKWRDNEFEKVRNKSLKSKKVKKINQPDLEI